MTKYRHELKFEVSDIQLKEIEYRIRPFMMKDSHQPGDYYLIRSAYFDDMCDSCFEENYSGIDNRRKFRIRVYGGNNDLIHLEKKSKKNGMTHKDSVNLSKQVCDLYLTGKIPELSECKSDLEKELFAEAKSKGMRAKCIVEYERSAYVYKMGNVRVTFDRNIRACGDVRKLFDDRIDATPVLETGRHVLEVKYDEFLPHHLLEVLDLGSLRRQSFSKYCNSRVAINSGLQRFNYQ